MTMMEQDKPLVRTRRRFTKEFKADATALVLDGEQSIARVARDLGTGRVVRVVRSTTRDSGSWIGWWCDGDGWVVRVFQSTIRDSGPWIGWWCDGDGWVVRGFSVNNPRLGLLDGFGVRRGIDWGTRSDSRWGVGPPPRWLSRFDDTPLVSGRCPGVNQRGIVIRLLHRR